MRINARPIVALIVAVHVTRPKRDKRIILLQKQNFLLHVEFTVDDYNLTFGIAFKANFSVHW